MGVFDDVAVTTVASGLLFPEGVATLADGSVLIPEIEGGRVSRVDAAGGRSVLADVGGGANGLAVGPDGAVYVCNDGGFTFTTEDGIRFPSGGAADSRGGAIQRVDPATGAVETVYTECDGIGLGVMNDIVFDRDGRFYAVDTTVGRVCYGDTAGGRIETVVDGLEVPNGAGLSPAGDLLYVTETFSGLVLRWRVVEPGVLAERTELYSSAGRHRWDGLAVDGAGNVCGANLEESGVTVIAPDGTELGAWRTPLYDSYVTNVRFGGPDHGTAYVSSAGRGILYALPWPWPGLAPAFQR